MLKKIHINKRVVIGVIILIIGFVSFIGFTNSLNFNSKEQWKTYSNPELGFSFDYPASYQSFSTVKFTSEFKENYLLSIFATSSEKIASDESYIEYITYPKLGIFAMNLDNLEYDSGYGRVTKYDRENDTFYYFNKNNERENIKPSLTEERWQAVLVGTGDAGWVDKSYLVANEEKNLGVIVSLDSGYYGENGISFSTHRPLDIDKIMETFRFAN